MHGSSGEGGPPSRQSRATVPMSTGRRDSRIAEWRRRMRVPIPSLGGRMSRKRPPAFGTSSPPRSSIAEIVRPGRSALPVGKARRAAGERFPPPAGRSASALRATSVDATAGRENVTQVDRLGMVLKMSPAVMEPKGRRSVQDAVLVCRIHLRRSRVGRAPCREDAGRRTPPHDASTTPSPSAPFTGCTSVSPDEISCREAIINIRRSSSYGGAMPAIGGQPVMRLFAVMASMERGEPASSLR